MAPDAVETAMRRKLQAAAELTELKARKLRGELVEVADLPLFAAGPMVRTGDHETSRAAAATVAPKINAIHTAVLKALDAAGPDGLNDRQLEQLPQFAHYGPSTVRKRRSELYQLGYVTHHGTRDGLMVWVRTTTGVSHP